LGGKGKEGFGGGNSWACENRETGAGVLVVIHEMALLHCGQERRKVTPRFVSWREVKKNPRCPGFSQKEKPAR